MKLKIAVVTLCFTLSIFAEQSVYSDSSFIDTDAVAKKNSREIFVLKQKIAQLKEKIEGLQSIIEGQSNTIEQLKAKTNNNLENIVNQLSQRVAALESSFKSLKKMQNSTSSTAINTNFTKQQASELKTAGKTQIKEKKISNKELYKQSVLNFKNGKLTKAKEGFETLIKHSYKRASCNFYLGEIAFKKGKYTEAISKYQKSVTINDNASYMDKLLLHTAIALKKKGKESEAKTFFQAVITGYPDSSFAKEAKKYLK